MLSRKRRVNKGKSKKPTTAATATEEIPKKTLTITTKTDDEASEIELLIQEVTPFELNITRLMTIVGSKRDRRAQLWYWK